MHTKSQIAKNRKVITVLFVFFGLISITFRSGNIPAAHAQGGYDPTVQTQTLLYDEARTVYLGNLARRDNGVPPLRWNRQLTHAGRWYSWDSTENRPLGFCGHQDTQGHWPDYRALAFGYLGGAGAENAFCGYLSPEDAIQGWMNSPGHRANLLDPNSREIGLGYYLRNSDGRGYVTQDFGNDAVYAPVIIENEAISTISPAVNLYIYDRSTGGGFAGLGTATQMMVSNNAQFSGASWELYNPNKTWTLATGDGWRKVYVKTRDKFNRSQTVSDTIYLGANVPLNELGAAQMATTQPQVTLYNLNGGTLPQAQFSLGWLADDTHQTFGKLWGNGERVNDTAAWGGTAYRLFPGAGESSAWVYDTTFIKDTPLVAYFRLKVNNNTSSSEVARVSVEGGGTLYGPLSLRGTNFTAPNQYQEFALNFTFNSNPDDAFLIFQFWGSGSADVYVDAVSIFSAPQALTSPLTWSVPGNNYRGQGVWVRYTNGSQFSAFSEATTTQTFTLTVNKAGNGTGTVTSIPAGISCGSDCSEQYDNDTVITLTASPATGSGFTGWSGGGCTGKGTCTVSLTAATSITANFAVLPGKVTLVAPSGSISSVQPAYTWNAVSAATWYYLYVEGPGGNNVIAEWYSSAGAGCSSGTGICSVTSGTILQGGAHRWWVQTWNGAGYGPWSAGMTFTTPTPTPPGVATLTSPNGNIISNNPTYTWNKVSEATWYYIYVQGPFGYIFTNWFRAVDVCGASTCSIATITPGLASGQYRWWIQTWNNVGYGPWSTGMTFTTTLPGAATLSSPNGATTNNPTYTWNKVSEATWYYIYVQGLTGYVFTQWYSSATACGASTCSVVGATPFLASGSYRWWIQTWNNVGYGPWSSGLNFSVP